MKKEMSTCCGLLNRPVLFSKDVAEPWERGLCSDCHAAIRREERIKALSQEIVDNGRHWTPIRDNRWQEPKVKQRKRV